MTLRVQTHDRTSTALPGKGVTGACMAVDIRLMPDLGGSVVLDAPLWSLPPPKVRSPVSPEAHTQVVGLSTFG